LKKKSGEGSGEALAAELLVKNVSGNPVDAGSISLKSTVLLSSDALTFDPQTAKTTSDAKTLTLTNSGSSPLTGFEGKISGANAKNFSETNKCGSTLAAGAKCVFSLTFAPTSSAKFAAEPHAPITAGLPVTRAECRLADNVCSYIVRRLYFSPSTT
jgi:hypothetical protein